MSKRIGVLGGGQLGRMLALAGIPLGFEFVFVDPSPDAPMRAVGTQILGAYDDPQALAQLADTCDVVTFEFENVPMRSVETLAAAGHVAPPARALEIGQDRLREKTFFRELGAQTPAFAAVDSPQGLHSAITQIGLPAVLKTRRMGYDGKGQWRLRTPADVDALALDVSAYANGLILEAFVPFERELSIIGVRGSDGDVCCYPLTENTHRDGILRISRAPAADAPNVTAQALMRRTLDALDYVGVLAIELFEHDRLLLVNEMAPRVHNSGHWTIEGAITSQFENHVRAIAGLPLGDTAARGYAAMVNLIGALPDVRAMHAVSDAHVHLYGKAPRPGRKLGHVTVIGNDVGSIESTIAQIARAADAAAG